VPMAVCSRTKEFETLGIGLRLWGAVAIEPLTREQVDAYLDRAGVALDGVRQALAGDETLYELLDSPLMVSITMLAYRGIVMLKGQTVEERRAALFAEYTDAMFNRRGIKELYSRKQTERWLSWLARQMRVHDQSEFLVERMQPDWLPTPLQRWIDTWGIAIAFGTIYGLAFGLVFGPVFALVASLGGALASFSRHIRPVKPLRWSWSAARAGLRRALVSTFIIAVGFALVNRFLLKSQWTWFDVLLGVLAAGLASIAGAGLVAVEMTGRAPSSDVMCVWLGRSLLGGLAGGLLGGLMSVLIDVLPAGRTSSSVRVDPLTLGACGVAYGLTLRGGPDSLRHSVLRLLFWQNDSAPLNYARFLDYATARIFLRKVGGGYIFIHRLLQDYFAELWEREYGGAE